MEEPIRPLIQKKRTRSEDRLKPSEAFARHFGEKHGVELLLGVCFGYKPLSFSHEEEE